MSVVRDKESQTVVEGRRQVRHTTLRQPSVRTKPTITVRTRYIEKPATRPSIWPGIAAKSSVFAVVAGAAFFMSSITGHVVVERARKDLNEMRTRTAAAKKAEASIRDRVNLLTRADKVEEWAVANGMTPIDGLGVTHGAGTH